MMPAAFGSCRSLSRLDLCVVIREFAVLRVAAMNVFNSGTVISLICPDSAFAQNRALRIRDLALTLHGAGRRKLLTRKPCITLRVFCLFGRVLPLIPSTWPIWSHGDAGIGTRAHDDVLGAPRSDRGVQGVDGRASPAKSGRDLFCPHPCPAWVQETACVAVLMLTFAAPDRRFLLRVDHRRVDNRHPFGPGHQQILGGCQYGQSSEPLCGRCVGLTKVVFPPVFTPSELRAQPHPLERADRVW